jgi:valyl-tRNA synthetase
VERLFGAYQFGEAGRQIYDFFWNEFADWYVEIAKQQLSEGGDRAYYTANTLVKVLDTCLRLLHPFTPFVTEELWNHLKNAAEAKSESYAPRTGWEEALIVAHWPEAQLDEGWEEQKVADFTLVQELVRAIRNLRSEKKVTPGKRIPAILAAGDSTAVLEAQKKVITSLAYLDPTALRIVPTIDEKPQGAASQVAAGIEIYLLLADLIDVEVERVRIQKDLDELEGQISRLEALLSGSFAAKAPAAVVDKERQKLVTYKESVTRLKEQIAGLG